LNFPAFPAVCAGDAMLDGGLSPTVQQQLADEEVL
jgi:hypothetical protein